MATVVYNTSNWWKLKYNIWLIFRCKLFFITKYIYIPIWTIQGIIDNIKYKLSKKKTIPLIYEDEPELKLEDLVEYSETGHINPYGYPIPVEIFDRAKVEEVVICFGEPGNNLSQESAIQEEIDKEKERKENMLLRAKLEDEQFVVKYKPKYKDENINGIHCIIT